LSTHDPVVPCQSCCFCEGPFRLIRLTFLIFFLPFSLFRVPPSGWPPTRGGSPVVSASPLPLAVRNHTHVVNFIFFGTVSFFRFFLLFFSPSCNFNLLFLCRIAGLPSLSVLWNVPNFSESLFFFIPSFLEWLKRLQIPFFAFSNSFFLGSSFCFPSLFFFPPRCPGHTGQRIGLLLTPKSFPFPLTQRVPGFCCIFVYLFAPSVFRSL